MNLKFSINKPSQPLCTLRASGNTDSLLLAVNLIISAATHLSRALWDLFNYLTVDFEVKSIEVWPHRLITLIPIGGLELRVV